MQNNRFVWASFLDPFTEREINRVVVNVTSRKPKFGRPSHQIVRWLGIPGAVIGLHLDSGRTSAGVDKVVNAHIQTDFNVPQELLRFSFEPVFSTSELRIPYRSLRQNLLHLRNLLLHFLVLVLAPLSYGGDLPLGRVEGDAWEALWWIRARSPESLAFAQLYQLLVRLVLWYWTECQSLHRGIQIVAFEQHRALFCSRTRTFK